MGIQQSKSSNVVNATTKAIATVATDIIQNTTLSEYASQIISVKNIDGDVHVEGNKFSQTATINMTALMTALAQTDVQQKIAENIAQASKSVTSGLSLNAWSSSDANNTLNAYMKSILLITTNISQSCGASMSNSQSIIIDRVKGNVYIQNNIFDQVLIFFQIVFRMLLQILRHYRIFLLKFLSQQWLKTQV